MTHRRSSLALICAFGVLPLLPGCGDGSGTTGDGGAPPKTTSGVTGSKTIGSLSDADTKAICAWTASLYGGYGGKVVCDNGSGSTVTISGPADLAECLAEATTIPATCKATVAQAESCTRAMSTCDQGDDDTAASACAAMMACLTP